VDALDRIETDVAARDVHDAPAPAPARGQSFEVVTDLDRLGALSDAWRDLLAPGRFFVGPDWILTWLRWRAADVTPHVVVGRDEHGRLASVLPLHRTADGELATCGAEHGAVHVDVVSTPEDARVAAEGALALLAREKAPRIRFHRLAEDGALYKALRRDVVPGARVERPVTTCPYLVPESSWEGFLGRLSKHQRHEVQRQCRRFLEREGAAVRWVREPEACATAVAELFDLHERRFADLDRSSAFTGAALRDFHVALATGLAREGRLLLGFLDAEGRTVASVYGFHCGSTTYMFQAGIDPDFSATGAGVVLRAHVLRDEVIAAGRHELDLLDGCQAWKLRWASGVRVIFDVDLYPATLAGRARGAVAQGVASLREKAADVVKGMRCPGRPEHEVVDPKYCQRLNCRFSPPTG